MIGLSEAWQLQENKLLVCHKHYKKKAELYSTTIIEKESMPSLVLNAWLQTKLKFLYNF